MKIFPSKEYSVTLINDGSESIAELRKETLSEDQFVSNWNSQTFIGRIDGPEFEVKLSKKLYGTFCILKGKIERSNGILEIRISKIFKVLFWVLFLFPIIGFFISVIQNGFYNSVDFIIPTLLLLLVIRFVFIGLGFTIFSRKAIKKLSKTIGIEKMKTGHNNI